MASVKDRIIRRLRKSRAKETRIVKRAMARYRKARTAVERRRALRVARRHRRKKRLFLRKIRHRRRVLGRRNRGLTWYDGVRVASWIVPFLVRARRDGVRFVVVSGYRSDAEQVRLWLHPQGYPVAKPRSLGGNGSKHNGRVYPDGAADLRPKNALDANLDRRGHVIGGKRLDSSPPSDAVHYSRHDPSGRY